MKYSLYQNVFILFMGLILSIGFLIGCVDTNEDEGFRVKSWSTKGYGTSQVNLTFEVEIRWSSGRVDLYNPSEKFVDYRYVSNTTHHLSFFLFQERYNPPPSGMYHLYATEIIAGKNYSVVKKDFILQDANLSITKCDPSWEFAATLDAYIFKSVNLTVENHGNFFGFIYEGRIIVDNGSTFFAPDYHWHDLNVWIVPGGNISLDLPVEVPIRPIKNHEVKIFLQDTQLVIVASYESALYPPTIP